MEDHLDGHMCRCTGYRSILDAARSFANGGAECVDIEVKIEIVLRKDQLCLSGFFRTKTAEHTLNTQLSKYSMRVKSV